MHLIDIVKATRDSLEKSGIEDAYREAELIVSHSLGIDRASLYRQGRPVPEDIVSKIGAVARRRAEREPLQYILGSVDFCGLTIRVGPGVLIPRPETELLAEEAIKILKDRDTNPPSTSFAKGGHEGIARSGRPPARLRILDLCTGSGCLALALANALPDAMVCGTDTEEAALRYAEENAKTNSIENVFFLKGSIFEPLEKYYASRGELPVFELIISNPPYIRREDVKTLQPEIRDWEPLTALDGGEDGLDYYRAIISGAIKHMSKQGLLMLELGIHQEDAVRRMAEEAGFPDISVKKDYAGIGRIFIAKA